MRPARTPGFLVALLALACDRGAASPGPSVARVSVRPAAAVLVAGQSLQLQAQADDASGRPVGGAELSFESASPSVVRVSELGLVTSRGGLGSATIVVSSSSHVTPVPVIVIAGPANGIDKISGDAQTMTVAGSLHDPLVVKAVDANGNPVRGVAVTFVASAGTTGPQRVITAKDGTASTVWTLGPAAGAQSLTARLEGADAGVTFSALAVAEVPSLIVKVSAEPTNLVAGASATLAVRVTDLHGNPTPGVGVIWRVTAGGGTAEPESAVADDGGVARVRWTTGARTAENQLAASIADAAAPPLIFSTTTVPGPPARVESLADDRPPATVRAPAQIRGAVRVTDGNGNPVPGAAVHFHVVEGGGKIDKETMVTGADGTAATTWSVAEAGPQRLSAGVEGVPEALELRVVARSGRRR